MDSVESQSPPTRTVIKEVVLSRAGLLVLGLSAIVRLAYSAWAQITEHDARVYANIAHYLVTEGTYRAWYTDAPVKSPGYPFFLAALYAIGGEHRWLVYFAQHALDMGTAVLVLAIANRLGLSRRVAWVAFVLALFDPFTFSYATMVLSETLTMFLVTAIVWLLLELPGAGGRRIYPLFACIGGLLSYAALCRPAIAPLAPALLIVLALLRRVPAAVWFKGCTVAALAFVIVWAPWGIRNAVRFHRFMPYHEGSYSVHTGYNKWTYNWIVHIYDIYAAYFWVPADPPPKAYETAQEREEVQALIAKRDDASHPPSEEEYRAIDARFDEIAEARIRAHPVKYWLGLPFERCLAMWFTRETTVLAQANVQVGSLGSSLRERPLAVAAKAGIFLLMPTLPALMLIGCILLWRRGRRDVLLPLTAGGVLTILTQVVMLSEPSFLLAMEPRYVIEAFPGLTPAAALGGAELVALVRRVAARLVARRPHLASPKSAD